MIESFLKRWVNEWIVVEEMLAFLPDDTNALFKGTEWQPNRLRLHGCTSFREKLTVNLVNKICHKLHGVL